MKRRTLITGIGVLAPNAIGKEAFWKALAAGESGIKRITRFDASSYRTQIAGEIRDFDPMDYMSPRDVRRTPRTAQLAVEVIKTGASIAGAAAFGSTEVPEKSTGIDKVFKQSEDVIDAIEDGREKRLEPLSPAAQGNLSKETLVRMLKELTTIEATFFAYFRKSKVEKWTASFRHRPNG